MKTPITRTTHNIDATGLVLGRLATRVATLLRGKHKPTYQPHIDAGDIINIRNASSVKITGQKLQQKLYHHYSGYPGGMKTKNLASVMRVNPSEALRKAVYNMLPPTRLRKGMMNRLRIEN